MDAELLALLRRVDTPTVCNAIEVVQGGRGFADFTRRPVTSSDPAAGAMVGYARCAVLESRAPASEDAETLRARRLAYYRYMSEGSRPAVCVTADADAPGAPGAFWGEVNTTIHAAFGIAGAITSGPMRDLGSLAEGFVVLAAEVLPSHAFVRVRDVDVPVEVFGLRISPGDLVHADRHGAVVIPEPVVDEIGSGIARLLEMEGLVLGSARREGFDFGALEAAWLEFERARASRS
ncbi:MAG: RraA family protein [Alphaproteobacteria bacterium]|nr:RraA family protein [Alphaproteobacteria bacterium]